MKRTTTRSTQEEYDPSLPTRAANLSSEFGALRRDWFASHGIDIKHLTYRELRDTVRQFYEENRGQILDVIGASADVDDASLRALARTHLDAGRIAVMRATIGLPKWVSLAETVAFVKTILDTDSGELREKYATYCATGIGLDDLRRTLAYEYDVKPARIDTDIYHQTAERSRAIVEVVSNAVDALNTSGITIGRFGVGFYQILSHLQHPEDRVRVTTRTEGERGTRISFRISEGEIQVQLEAAPEDAPRGTTVELSATDFPADEAAALVKKHFAYNSIARVHLDDRVVNDLSSFGVNQEACPDVSVSVSDAGFVVQDRGRGMPPQVILEKLLVPKQSDKTAPHELAERVGLNVSFLVEHHPEGTPSHAGHAVLNVGGVVIEDIELAGVHVAKTLVIDLPSFTLLGEERGEVAVDEVTIRAVQSLIDRIVAAGDIPTINALAQVVEHLRRRSRRHERDLDLAASLRRAAEQLPDGVYLPNAPGFERLEIPGAILIDPAVRQTSWQRIPQIRTVPLTGDGLPVHIAPLRQVPGQPIIRWRNRILLDEAVVTRCGNDPTVVNLLLSSYGDGHGVKVKSLEPGRDASASATQTVRENQELRPTANLQEYLEREWAANGFPTKATATTWCERFTPEQHERAALLHAHLVDVLPQGLIAPYIDRLLFGELWVKSDTYPIHVTERPVTAEVLASLASLAADPSLPQALLDHGAQLRLRPEPLLDAFGETDTKYWEYKYRRANTDATGRWYTVTYWDRENLVHEDGTVIPHGSESLDETTRLVRREDDRVALFDIPSRSFRTETLPAKVDGHALMYFSQFTFGDHRVIQAQYGEFMRETYCFFDRETLQPFNPAPDLGMPKKYDTLYHDANPPGIPHFKYVLPGAELKDSRYPSIGDHGVVGVLADGRRLDRTAKNWKEILRWPPEKGASKVFRTEAEGETVRISAGDTLIRTRVVTGAREKAARGWGGWTTESMALYLAKPTYLRDGEEELCLVEESQGTGRKIRIPIDKSGNRYHDNKWNEGCTVEVEEAVTILFDATGARRFELLPTERIFTTYTTPEGALRFIVVRHSQVIDWTTIEEYYLLDAHGTRLSREELRSAPRIEFRWNENEYSFDNVEGMHSRTIEDTTSLCEGETWRLSFIATTFQSKKHKQEWAYAMQLVDKVTRAPLLPYRFRAVCWNATTQRYECTVLDHEEEDGQERTRIVYVDETGTVLEERVTGGRTPNACRAPSAGGGDRRDAVPLLTPIQKLSPVQACAAAAALNASVREDVKTLERFTSRLFRYAHLSDAAFTEIAPVLLAVEHLNRRIMREEVLQELSVRLREYDDETRVWFYRFLMRLTPPGPVDEVPSAFIEKFLRVFHDKLASEPETEKQRTYETFCQVRDYDERFLVNGWNIVRHRTPVPSAQIPERIRPLIDYLRCDEAEAFAAVPPAMTFRDGVGLTLSQLIQTKRLHETRTQRFTGSIGELKQFVEGAAAGRSQEHIQREIIHPIAYQGVNNPYLFLRELVQNAHDAVAVHGDETERHVAIDLFSRSEGSVTVRIEDHVGMALQEVLNAFLIPEETTKIGDDRNIGSFGQGLFTLFRGANEVTLKTSTGDGTITKLRITPIAERQGTIVDLQLTLEQEDGDFKGTVIERTVVTSSPTVEAAYVKNAACTFVSLVDAATVEIRMNGAPINTVQHELAKVDVPGIGAARIYDAPNNVVTQRGLFLKPLDADYATNLTDVERLLTARGYVLRIPDGVSLTRSRNDIARKQDVLPALQEYLPLLKLRAYLEVFRLDILKGHTIQLEHLPYDYFYARYPTSGPIFEDAERMRRGKPVIDAGRYLDRGSLIALLVLLPAVEIDGAVWSLAQLKEASHANRRPLETLEKYEQLPGVIRSHLLEGKKRADEMHRAMEDAESQKDLVADFSWGNLSAQPAFVQELVATQRVAYERLIRTAEHLNATVGASLGLASTPRTTLYHEPDSKAHATQGAGLFSTPIVGWNLKYWRSWRVAHFADETVSHRELREFLDVWSHELGHVLEHSGDFSHNPHFSLRQAEALAHLLASDALDMIRHPSALGPIEFLDDTLEDEPSASAMRRAA